MDHAQLIRFAHQLADRASEETLPRFRSNVAIDNKNEAAFDPVTDADREAERAIRALIEEHFPDHGIKGEEFPEKKGAGRHRWVLDPVDGTRAFICGAPVWTTLIALEQEGQPMLGVIDQPHLKERWIGLCPPREEPRLETSGLPAGASSCTDLSTARMMVTDMRAGEYFTIDEAGSVARLASKVRLTRQGLDSYGFGLLASGQMDLVVEAGLQWHDIAAVIPVIEAAGGVVTDWHGAHLTDMGGTIQCIVAATSDLAEAAATVLTT